MDTVTIDRRQARQLREAGGGAITVTPPCYEAEVLTSIEALESIAEDWRALERAATTPAAFQSYSWCRFVVRRLAAIGMPVDIRIIVLRSAGRLVALWPLKIERSLSVRTVSDLTDPFGQYAEVLVAAGEAREHAIARLVEEARKLAADAIIIRKVRTDSLLAPALAAKFQAARGGEAAAAIEFATDASFDDYYKTVKSKTRKNIRNAHHRFERVGEITHSVEWERLAIRNALLGAVKQRRNWLDEKGLSSRAFSHRGFAALIGGLADTEQHDLDLMVMTLACNGEMAAVQWGIVHNGRYYAYMAGKNAAFDAHSPGKLHLDYIVRAAFEARLGCVDMLAPAMPYKLTWANAVTSIDDYTLPLTAAGWLATTLSQGNMRRLAKHAFLRLPESVRRPVVRAIARGGKVPVTAVDGYANDAAA